MQNANQSPAHQSLRAAKRQALGLLLLVTAVFIGTSLVERGLLLDCVKAMAEAAMVGALADWFAVVALFRRPLGCQYRTRPSFPATKIALA